MRSKPSTNKIPSGKSSGTVPEQLTLHFKDSVCEQIWIWDRSKNPYGPVSVETIWKEEILDQWESGEK